MSSKSDFFLKKTLGSDFFESLQKVELWKPGTRTTIDHEEIKTALHIVPRTVMSLLIRELKPMEIGENKEVTIPCEKQTTLKATKHERDVYTGVVEQENKVIVDFKYRSIPGIGLVVMSALELYDVDELTEKPKENKDADVSGQVQKMIDERMALHELVNKVVDRKMMEKDAVQQLILARISESIHQAKSQPEVKDESTASLISTANLEKLGKSADTKKKSPLGGFLDQRKTKLKKNEFSIQLAKGECVNCADCGGNIFDGQAFSGCICVGDDMDKKVYLKKTEEGIKVRFGKGWEQENIEMLLEMLRSKNVR